MDRAQWNFSALMGAIVVISMNAVCGAGVLMGKMTFEQYAAATGAVNGIAIGWVGKVLTSGGVSTQ